MLDWICKRPTTNCLGTCSTSASVVYMLQMVGDLQYRNRSWSSIATLTMATSGTANSNTCHFDSGTLQVLSERIRDSQEIVNIRLNEPCVRWLVPLDVFTRSMEDLADNDGILTNQISAYDRTSVLTTEGPGQFQTASPPFSARSR